MEFELPEIPVYILGVLALITPWVISLINALVDFGKLGRRLVSVLVSVVIAAAVLAWYYYATGTPVPEWPVLVLLYIAVVQASFALFAKGTADKLEDAVAVKRKTAVALIPRRDNGHPIVQADPDGARLAEVGGWTEEPFDLEKYFEEMATEEGLPAAPDADPPGDHRAEPGESR